MKKVVFALTVCFSLLFAEDKTSITGSLENNFTALTRDTSVLYSNTETFRLGIKKDFGNKGGLETELVYNTGFSNADPTAGFKSNSFYSTAINTFIQNSMKDISVTSTEDSVLDVFKMHLMNYIARKLMEGNIYTNFQYMSLVTRDEFRIDKALIKIFTKPADFYLGKQQIGWGTGYAWNPTDVFNRKDPLDAKAIKLGALSVRSEIGLPDNGLLSIVLVPGHEAYYTTLGARAIYSLLGFDVSLSAVRMHNVDREIYGLPKKIQLGADIAGEITPKSIGVWAEGCLVNPAYNGYSNFDSMYVQAVAGANYTFENGIFIMGEYYFNGKGNNTNRYTIEDLLMVLSNETSGLAKQYVFAGITKKFLDDYLEIKLFGNGNMVDKSAAVIPSAAFGFSDNINMEAGATLFAGKIDSEFGSLYNAVFFKVKAFF